MARKQLFDKAITVSIKLGLLGFLKKNLNMAGFIFEENTNFEKKLKIWINVSKKKITFFYGEFDFFIKKIIRIIKIKNIL